ncbi:MAG: DUF4157 domain-containing protein [Leptospirales bacterium]
MSLSARAQKQAGEKNSSSKTSTNTSPVRTQSPQSIHNRRDYIMHLQRTIGNRAVEHLWKSGWLQRKLNIGPANDKYEQEADAVADKVVSMNEPQVGSGVVGNSPSGETQQISRTPLADSITPLQRSAQPEEEDVQKAPAPEEEEAQGKFLQREAKPEEEEARGKFLQSKCATCEKEEAQAKIQRRLVNPASLCSKCRSNSPLQMMQRKCLPVRVNPMNRQYSLQQKYFTQKKGNGSTPASPNIESSIQSSRGGGRSLSPGERSYYEPRFGTNFAGVKIHTGGQANHLSRSVNARAFTVGNDIFFGSGEYSPNTIQGKKLMAHELTHTVQQGRRQNGPMLKSAKKAVHLQKKGEAKERFYTPSIANTFRVKLGTKFWKKYVGYKFKKDTNVFFKGVNIRYTKSQESYYEIYSNTKNKFYIGWVNSKYLMNMPTFKSGKINRLHIPFHPGWQDVSPTYFVNPKWEPYEAPHFMRVRQEAKKGKELNVIVLEGRFKGKDAFVKQERIGKNRSPKGIASLTFEATKETSTRLLGHLHLGSSGKVKAFTQKSNRVPPGKHNIEIPDFQHYYGRKYGPFGTTWFRIGHSGDRYIHPGLVSLGCVTVDETTKWPMVYHYLIEARKNSMSVGEITVKYNVGDKK